MRPVFKAYTGENHLTVARGSALSATQYVDSAEQDLDNDDCGGALNELRLASFELGQAAYHQDYAERGGESIASVSDLMARVYSRKREARENFLAKCVLSGMKRGASAPEAPADIDVEEVEAAPKPPKAKKAKAPKRVKAPKTDWLEPPPSEPGIPDAEMEEAVEAARAADTEGPRITIRPATDEDAPDVGAKLTLEPGDGTWSEPPKRKRNERKAAPREIPPLPEEAFKPARKKAPGERGNTRTLEYTSRSGKVCRIRINSRPDGCLLIED
jgi:hypothetical protein